MTGVVSDSNGPIARALRGGLAALLAATAAAMPAAGPVRAADVEFRLVPHDRPDATVDSLQRARPVTRPVRSQRGVEFRKIGLDVVCWGRNVLLDGKPIFERYHQGKYIDRAPRARRALKKGKHVLWPGNHAFTLADDGTITTDSPELIVGKGLVRIKSYPVTVRARDADPGADPAATPEPVVLPELTLRDAAEHAAIDPKKGTRPHDLLPIYERFVSLTIYLPASRAAGGYVLHPMGLAFELGPAGLTPSGPDKPIPGMKIDRWTVEVPLLPLPATGEAGCGLVVQGVEKVSWSSRDAGQTKRIGWYPRRAPYELRISEAGPGLRVDGAILEMPVKSLHVARGDRAKGLHRAVLAELAGSHYRPGERAGVRIRAVAPSGGTKGTDDGVNLLAGATPFGRMQALDGGAWTELSLARGQGGKLTFVVPALPADVYRLRLGVRARGETAPAVATEILVTVSPDRPAAIGLFTQRGRSAFFRGEAFWIGLGAVVRRGEIPAGALLRIGLVDAGGRTIEILREKLTQPIGKRETFLARIDAAGSRAIAPGEYRVEARLGGLLARGRRITIVEPQPRTHFMNLLNGKYNTLGAEYGRVIRSGRGAGDLARTIVSMGYNGFMGMSYDVSRVVHPGAAIERLVRRRPELGPWESYLQPSGRDRFLDEAVRNNLRFWENMLTYNDTSLPRAESILAACERFTGLEVASMEHSPAFQGVCLYDEVYARSLNDGVPVVSAFERAHEISYRRLHPGLTSAKAMKALERFLGRPAGQRPRKDLATYRTWPEHEDRAWRVFTARLAGAAKRAMPGSFNFSLHRYFGHNGGNLGIFGREEDVYAPLDAAACVMYKDGGSGDRPVFAPMQADVMRVREGLPVWTQLHNFSGEGIFGAHLLRQAFLALSQKIEGFSYFTIQHDPRAPQYTDNRQTIRAVAGTLCTRYGDFFLSLKRGYKKVAIYYSRQADHLTGRKANNLRCQCEGLWVACLRAGFPADFLRDGDLRAGRGMEYDVIFAPGFQFEEECSADILAALKRLVGAGKVLAVERSSKLPLDGLARLASELDEYDDKLGGAFPKFIDFESEMVWDQTERTTRLVREFLAPRIPPAARHDGLVGPDWLRGGKGEYLVLANFAPAGFTGLHKTLYQAPNCVKLSFPKRPGACYDLLEMRPVPVGTEGKWMTLQADMRRYPGKIYAFLPAAVESVALSAGRNVRAGGSLRYTVGVVDAKGAAIDASFPVEVRLTDPAGAVAWEIYRAAAPTFAGDYVVPVNAPAGNWTLRVRELISGAAAESRIAVLPAGPGSGITARLDRRKVLAYHARQVRSFLAARNAPAIAIPLSASQAWARPAAEALRDRLARRGRVVNIVPVEKVLRLPGPWDGKKPVLDGSRLWRGDKVLPDLLADSPLILLGRRGENAFLDALIRRDALPAPVTDAFPGPRRAILAWTPRAFSNAHDTVSVLACDADGLAAGVEALLAGPEGSPPAEPAHPTVQAVAPKPPAPEGLRAGTKAPRDVSSFGEAIFGQDLVRCIHVDPKTGRTLLGTFGYGQNLFCLAPDGKLLWKTFLPEHNVYFARWYDAGRRVVAATGKGWFVFLLDGANGKVLRKFASSEWPRMHYNEGAVETEVHIEVNPALRQILIGGLSGLMAVDFDGKRQWFDDRAEAIVSIPKEADPGSAAAAFGNSLAVGNFALSPDGSKIALGEYEICGSTLIMQVITNVWAYRPKILDARTGKVLGAWRGDPGNQTHPRGWHVGWPGDSNTPTVHTAGLAAPLRLDGTLGPYAARAGRRLADGTTLIAWPTGLQRRDRKGKSLWRTENLPLCIPELDRTDEPAGRLYRCDQDGGVHCFDLAGGKAVWSARMPFASLLAPRADGLTAAGLDGTVRSFGKDGRPRWSVRLGELHEMPRSDYAAYVAAARRRDVDSTSEVFPAGEDRPGEYDAVLRMGIEQIADGTFEARSKAWVAETGAPALDSQAHAGRAALRLVPGQLVTQKLARRVVPSATYVLEFFFRPTAGGAKLIAGAQLTGESEILTASTFRGRPGQWCFGRLAIKSMAATRQMAVGFEAVGGEVRVDDASLRPVRFPSANLLACPELHAVEPTFVGDLRVRYKKIPTALEARMLDRSRVAAFKQGGTDTATLYTEEQALLHNGRLDDVGAIWTYVPEAMGFSVVLTQPAWVSHLVLYLNNAVPDNVYRTLSIVANDLDAKMPRSVALVRNNRRRFVVVHFAKPLHTDSLKILPGRQARAHRDCLTEVEVYGPLGGPDAGRAGRRFPADPNGWPMFMGTPSHVPARRPADLTGTYRQRGTVRFEPPAFFVGATVVDNVCTFGLANGSIRSIALPAPADPKARVRWGPTWTLGTIAPITTPARFAGRLLAGAADEKLHAVADNGAHLWAFQAEGRIYSSPVPDGDDVYFGSDDGRLYKVDIDSGILIWEFKTGGRIRGAPALAGGRVFVPSWDGKLYAVDAETGRLAWNAPIAKYSRSSPAVAGGRVYLGDEGGSIRCFDAASGKQLWAGTLGGHIVACPVVTADGAAFANQQGRVALAGSEGTIRWSRTLGSAIKGQPIATQSQLFVPTARGLEVLRLADGKNDTRLVLPPQPEGVISAVPYGGRICVVAATARTHRAAGRTYVRLEGRAMLWVPQTKPSPAGGGK